MKTLSELAKQMPVLNEIQQKLYIGGDDSALNQSVISGVHVIKVKKSFDMKKIVVLFYLILFSIPIQLYAQDQIKNFIHKNNIRPKTYEKIATILDQNSISYQPTELWNVVSDTLTNNVFKKDSCYINRILHRDVAIMTHVDGNCMLAVSPAFYPLDGKKLSNPYGIESAKEYIFSYIAHFFGFGKPYHSLTKQDLKDVEMLVTYFPNDLANTIFNGTSAFVYPLSLKGEYCDERFHYGRGVVALGQYNIPLYLFFFMTDESIGKFDEYLSNIKGMFTFQDNYKD